MGQSCCGKQRKNPEPLGWEGVLFMIAGFGLVLLWVARELSDHKAFAENGMKIDGALLLLLISWMLRPRRKNEHPPDQRP